MVEISDYFDESSSPVEYVETLIPPESARLLKDLISYLEIVLYKMVLLLGLSDYKDLLRSSLGIGSAPKHWREVCEIIKKDRMVERHRDLRLKYFLKACELYEMLGGSITIGKIDPDEGASLVYRKGDDEKSTVHLITKLTKLYKSTVHTLVDLEPILDEVYNILEDPKYIVKFEDAEKLLLELIPGWLDFIDRALLDIWEVRHKMWDISVETEYTHLFWDLAELGVSELVCPLKKLTNTNNMQEKVLSSLSICSLSFVEHSSESCLIGDANPLGVLVVATLKTLAQYWRFRSNKFRGTYLNKSLGFAKTLRVHSVLNWTRLYGK